MEKAVHDLLAPIVGSFISDWGFAMFHKLGNWLETRFPNFAMRVVLRPVLGLAAISPVLMATALAGF